MEAGTLKINHKWYVQDLLETEKITLYNATIFSIKAWLFISIFQIGNKESTNFIAYQRLIGKQIYLAYKTQSNIFL